MNGPSYKYFCPESNIQGGWTLSYFSGGEKHDNFVKLFNEQELLTKFTAGGFPVDREVTIFGEAYGGKCQGMSATYGKSLKFVAFDVQVGDVWLDVPKAEKVCQDLGIEFVFYKQCRLTKVVKNLNLMTATNSGDEHVDWMANEPERVCSVETNLSEIDAERDAPSMQACRNGIITMEDYLKGIGPKREGVVLRPLTEFTLNNGSRVIVKHKRDEFRETASPRVVEDPAKLKVLTDAQNIADEWVTNMRLQHVLDKMPGHCMEKMRDIITAMQEDILREGAGEIVDGKEVRGAIGKKTVDLYKAMLKSSIK